MEFAKKNNINLKKEIQKSDKFVKDRLFKDWIKDNKGYSKYSLNNLGYVREEKESDLI